MGNVTTVSKWGNAQGIRIPKSFCEQLGISVGDKVSLAIEKGKIIIENPAENHTIQARMRSWDGTRSKTHEYDWGEPVGKEIW
jgi:antitoxin component of MazEF toxin-antitoxin module